MTHYGYIAIGCENKSIKICQSVPSGSCMLDAPLSSCHLTTVNYVVLKDVTVNPVVFPKNQNQTYNFVSRVSQIEDPPFFHRIKCSAFCAVLL